MDDPAPIDPDRTAHRVDCLTRLLGIGALALLGVTWKLWTPQDVFPRVPLLYWAPPHWLDWSSIALVVAGLLGLLFHRRVPERRIAATFTACGFALQFLADQHRLQPWAWQFFILTLVIALADDRTILVGWRWLVITIYAYSALSKLDYVFLTETSDVLLQPVWQVLGSRRPWSLAPWNRALWTLKPYLAALLPIGELAVAILLTDWRTRRWGLYGSWFMHMGLLGLLGPVGLGHSWGVLLWNAFFILQNGYLFDLVDCAAIEARRDSSASGVSTIVARCILVATYLWPALYPSGACDAWIGWTVYAPPARRIMLSLPAESAERLPSWMLRMVHPVHPTSLGSWKYLRLEPNDWSLETLHVPSYPSARFQAAVALELLLKNDLGELDFIVITRTSRWSSAVSTELVTHDKIWKFAGTFWFNAYPEYVYRRQAGERGDVSPPGD